MYIHSICLRESIKTQSLAQMAKPRVGNMVIIARFEQLRHRFCSKRLAWVASLVRIGSYDTACRELGKIQLYPTAFLPSANLSFKHRQLSDMIAFALYTRPGTADLSVPGFIYLELWQH